MATGRWRKQRFEEIDVVRINLVGKDGRVQLVLANKERLPNPVIDGKTLKRSGPPTPGLIFYNDEGDECGGRIFGGGRREGDTLKVGGALLFDQYKQDQVIGLYYRQEDNRRVCGLQIWDRPDRPLPEMVEAERREEKPEGDDQGVIRLFVGRTPTGEAAIRLSDRQGRERLRIGVDDVPRLEFLNEQGEVVYRLPPEG